MIIKSLSRKSNAGQLITYALRYVTHEKQNSKYKDDATLILRHNLRSRSVKGYIKEFKENESYRLYKRKDSVVLFHDVISFAPPDKEKITPEILKDISKKYISLRGNNCLFLIVRHQEKKHEHLHCIVSGVSASGYSARISKQKFRHLKIELEKFQQEKFPTLLRSVINHEKPRQKSKVEIVQTVKQVRQTDKQILLKALEENYTAASSPDDFLKRLKEQAYVPYFRNNRLQGLTIAGRKFRLDRLGYDAQKLKQLNYKHSVEERLLQELYQLRSGKTKAAKQQMQPANNRSAVLQDDIEQKMLDELEHIRNIKEEKEKEERHIDIDMNRADIETNQADAYSDTDDHQLSLFTPDTFAKRNEFSYECEE